MSARVVWGLESEIAVEACGFEEIDRRGRGKEARTVCDDDAGGAEDGVELLLGAYEDCL